MMGKKKTAKMRGGGKVKKTAKMRGGGKVKMFKKGGQGYTDRKDESIAMRIKKKRTPAQLKASRDESYGKFGKGTGKGVINKRGGGIAKRGMGIAK
jgi:hypothetical protein